MPANKEKCPSCGQFIKMGSPFCIRCGAQISRISVDEEDNIPEVSTPTPVPAQNSNFKSVSPIKKEAAKEEPPKEQPTESEGLTPAPYVQDIIDDEETEEVNNSPTVERSLPPEYNEEIEEDSEEEIEDNENDDINQDEEEMIEEMIEEEIDDESGDDLDNSNISTISDSEDLDDDDDAFNALINNEKKSAGVEKTEKPVKKKIVPTKKERIEVPEPEVPKIKREKVKVNRPEEKPKEEKVKKKVEKPSYNPNIDHYYDNVMAEVDARISHFTTENVVLTFSAVVLCIIILVFMVYCVVL